MFYEMNTQTSTLSNAVCSTFGAYKIVREMSVVVLCVFWNADTFLYAVVARSVVFVDTGIDKNFNRTEPSSRLLRICDLIQHFLRLFMRNSCSWNYKATKWRKRRKKTVVNMVTLCTLCLNFCHIGTSMSVWCACVICLYNHTRLITMTNICRN